LQTNIDSLQAALDVAGVRLRPHAKSHKSAFVAAAQLTGGAFGISCAKLSEAEALVSALHGSFDHLRVLVTSPLAHEMAAARAARLAENCELSVVADTVAGVELLAEATRRAGSSISIVCDVDVGLGRTGVTNPDAALAVADAAVKQPSTRFIGVQGYAGHLQHVAPRLDRFAGVAAASARLEGVISVVESAGHRVELRTGGGTGTWLADLEGGVLNEIQAGSYVFMDREYRDALGDDSEGRFEQSLFIDSTVISANHRDFVTVDAGLKSMATDAGVATIADRPDARFGFFGDEQGLVSSTGDALRVGDRLALVPPHCDPTVNLYDTLWLVKGDVVVGATDVTARGRSY
jgi:D-serine deaminase-like pyridoxal phosphate-dependent protein